MKWKVQETQFPAGAWGSAPNVPPFPSHVPRPRPHGIGRGRTSVSYEKNTYREVIP